MNHPLCIKYEVIAANSDNSIYCLNFEGELEIILESHLNVFDL